MKQVFDTTGATKTLKDLEYLFKQIRGKLNKNIDALRDERFIRNCRNEEGRRELEATLVQMLESVRVMSLFIEAEWSEDPVGSGLVHVMDLPDVLSKGMMKRIKDIAPTGDAQDSWDTMKTFLADKILGPPLGGFGTGVYAHSHRALSMIDAWQKVKARKK